LRRCETQLMTDGNNKLKVRSAKLKVMKDTLGLDENSKILLFSTEGDTDPEQYRSIVWDGQYPRV